MVTRGGRVHVVTTSRHHRGKVYEAHLLRQTYRADGKVKNRTADGLPLHSFRGLPRQFATLTTNRVRLKAAAAAFDQLTLPTPLQQRAFDLLGLSPNL